MRPWIGLGRLRLKMILEAVLVKAGLDFVQFGK
jgi:hypothetical protein